MTGYWVRASQAGTDKLLPAVDEGLAAAGRTNISRMIEIKLSHDEGCQTAIYAGMRNGERR